MPQIIQGININDTEGNDKLTDTQKITAGYFTGGGGQLDAANIHSGSLADSNEKYYFNITQTHPASASAETQFSVTYGHIGGSGSQTDGGNVEGPTEAIYKQWTNILLAENEVTGGFKISQQGSSGALSSGTKDSDIYVLVGKRARFKDRINKKNWTIALSGSTTTVSASLGGGTGLFYFTDDSNTAQATSTVAGPRYNIVSGSNGNVYSASSWKTYGWFYPDMGALVFSAAELSASMPGSSSGNNQTASFYPSRGESDFAGFSTNTDANGNSANALRFINCLQPGGAYLKFRSEEDQTSVSYFCRVKASQVNFSNNPTFVSGSLNELRITEMRGNPTVYGTGIQLYNQFGDIVAVGKLSTPVKKNFGSEVTIKVKLTF